MPNLSLIGTKQITVIPKVNLHCTYHFKVAVGKRYGWGVGGLDHGLGREDDTLLEGDAAVKLHIVNRHVAVRQAATHCLKHDLRKRQVN